MPIKGVPVNPKVVKILEELKEKGPGVPISITDLTASDRRSIYNLPKEFGCIQVKSGMIIEATNEEIREVKAKHFKKISFLTLNLSVWCSLLSLTLAATFL